MKKIAIPTRNGNVDDHFGHCEYYTVFTVEENQIISTERVESPEGCGCKTDIAITLNDMGVRLMLAGNMGDGAYNKLIKAGIQVIRGCSGSINTVMQTYLLGFMLDSGVGCTHNHEDGHECAH